MMSSNFADNKGQNPISPSGPWTRDSDDMRRSAWETYIKLRPQQANNNPVNRFSLAQTALEPYRIENSPSVLRVGSSTAGSEQPQAGALDGPVEKPSPKGCMPLTGWSQKTGLAQWVGVHTSVSPGRAGRLIE